MDKITMLGTGHAMTSECFNTCFVYENENGKMLVDTGGGQQLTAQLRKADINAEVISHVFLSHQHTDHILGLPWLMRLRLRTLEVHPLKIIAHRELCKTSRALLTLLLPEAAELIGKNLLFVPVEHAEKMSLLGREFQFYDTGCPEPTQFGFAMALPDGEKFVFNGDVPYHEVNEGIMRDAKWLMHEAFCLNSEKKFKMKKHSSVSEAAQNARDLDAKALILVHGSDNELCCRKERYVCEAARYFSGKIFVPNDLELLEL